MPPHPHPDPAVHAPEPAASPASPAAVAGLAHAVCLVAAALAWHATATSLPRPSRLWPTFGLDPAAAAAGALHLVAGVALGWLTVTALATIVLRRAAPALARRVARTTLPSLRPLLDHGRAATAGAATAGAVLVGLTSTALPATALGGGGPAATASEVTGGPATDPPPPPGDAPGAPSRDETDPGRGTDGERGVTTPGAVAPHDLLVLDASPVHPADSGAPATADVPTSTSPSAPAPGPTHPPSAPEGPTSGGGAPAAADPPVAELRVLTPDEPTPPASTPALPTPPPDAPDAATPGATTPAHDEWVIEPGDHLWAVSTETVHDHLGRAAEPAEIARYLQRLVADNAHVLVDPGNPDLVLPGQVFRLPPLAAAGVGT